MLTLHFIGLALAVGTGFAYLFLGLSSKGLSKTEGKNLFIKTLPIQKMSHIGLFLLILSGGYLMTPYWDTLMENRLLLVKLAAVIIMIALVAVLSSLAKVAKKEQGGEAMTKIQKLGKITLPLGLIIVVLAVLTFR
ncbi:MAG: putative membrane protein [Bacteroidia bacterium]|jgi:uncharacterized membrane protein